MLSPILQQMYNEAFADKKLPYSLREATITLLLKKDKHPLPCGSYRPISLLNVDSKILAGRLQQVILGLISEDQTGFMHCRHSWFNTRRLLDIISATEILRFS